MAAKPKRIDKEHGFMKSIIKNQVDRDRYNKEVEEERRNQHLPSSKIQLTESTSRKSSTPVCKPKQENPLLSENIKINDYIFKFEFEDAHGDVHHMMVSKSENAHSLARRMASQCNLPYHLIEALEIRLRREFNRKKRRNEK